MKVAVLGAGAMGSFIGAHMQKGGADVILVDPFKAHMEKIAKEGLTMQVGENTEVIPMKAVLTPEEAGNVDVVVVLVKGLYTRSALEGATALFGPDTVAVSFQNGVGNVDIMKEFLPDEKIGYGTLNISSFLREPGSIYGNPGMGVAIHFCNETKTKTPIWQEIEDALNKGGLVTEFSDATNEFIWKKLLVNSCVNLTCGITRINMGQLWDHPDGAALEEAIARELVAVAQAKGINITFDEAWGAYVNELLPKTRDHYPSATQDIMNKRLTEVDFLNGAVVRGGIETGIPTPVNDVIVKISHILQDTYDVQFGTNK
ncbi:MAG: 2-dehydropantoate 2-reductase [Eubacteriaceae bacterium]|jgi:2-dehydropantoate 2-reductase|nr:2-dehydropantoate 2-reductase [Eubacteriaceae bacterium]